MSDNQTEIVTITITDSGYWGTGAGIDKPLLASSLAGLADLAMSVRHAAGVTEFIRWKVAPWNLDSGFTRISAAVLLDLLRLPGGRRNVEMSQCDFSAIDLSEDNVERLGVESELRWLRGHGINLSDITMAGASFKNAKLSGAGFVGSDLHNCSFPNADLKGADFSKANLDDAWFTETELEGASFSRASIRRVQFFRARLSRSSFTEATLERSSFFQCDLDGARFYMADLTATDFRGLSVGSGVGWTDARFDRTWLYRADIEPVREETNAETGVGGYRQATEVFLSLKANFMQIGNYEDASWAYVKEQQMEKAFYFPTTDGKRWLVEKIGFAPPHWFSYSPRHLWYRLRSVWYYGLLHNRFPPIALEDRDRRRWARNWAYELLTGYGENPLLPLVWGAVTIVAFFLAFLVAGNIATGDPSLGASPSHDPLDALTHSISAFATIGFNMLEPIGWGARLMTAVESMLGIGFFALFIYTLGNRMSRS